MFPGELPLEAGTYFFTVNPAARRYPRRGRARRGAEPRARSRGSRLRPIRRLDRGGPCGQEPASPGPRVLAFTGTVSPCAADHDTPGRQDRANNPSCPGRAVAADRSRLGAEVALVSTHRLFRRPALEACDRARPRSTRRPTDHGQRTSRSSRHPVAQIRYTTDGSAPTSTHARSTRPVTSLTPEPPGRRYNSGLSNSRHLALYLSGGSPVSPTRRRRTDP